ncbi:MAG: DUF5069 domain-containing protein [Verrucomicrobia bacterium RIFCSPLOWO2_12_FULL_64_8]|nr:MAG: DUF5069 domain-containing protein [Verrucomicrobia bacterium RIFCSPLOWO2_12_FULL_64_8]
MRHYDFASRLRVLWDKACRYYHEGRRGAQTYFTPDENAFLAADGLTAQHLYDYAEDFTADGEPSWETALAIELVRRDYFLNVQGGKPSPVVLDEAKLPAKTDAVRGVEWLPRLIPKTRAKLRGELPPTLMYCCGGDRRFFKTHDIHPAEFLSLIWRKERNDDDDVIDWVARSSAIK